MKKKLTLNEKWDLRVILVLKLESKVVNMGMKEYIL